MMKRILAMLLVVMMVVSILPLTISASEEGNTVIVNDDGSITIIGNSSNNHDHDHDHEDEEPKKPTKEPAPYAASLEPTARVASAAETSTGVAKVGNTEYATLQEAINACKNGETVKLLADITYTEGDVISAIGGATGFGQYYNPCIISIGGAKGENGAANIPSSVNAVIDLNGHTLKNTADAYFFMIMDNAKVTFTDSVGGGKVITTADGPAVWVIGTETLVTIKGGYFETASAGGVIHSTHGGDLVIEGGEFDTTATDKSLLIMLNSKDRQNSKFFISGVATVTINGGTFHDFNPTEVGDDNGATSIEDIKFVDGCSDGYVPVENNDGTFGVKPWYDADAEKLYINNLTEFIAFAETVNSGVSFDGQTVILNADIDLTGKVWTPIGTSNYDKTPTTAGVKMFAGNFDGGNHTITGLSSEGYVPDAAETGSTEYSFGLFGYVYGANISNVKLANVNINCCTRKDSAGNDVDGSGVAALIGYYFPANDTATVIENCHVLSGTVKASNNMGGLIGHLDSQLSQPKVDITIKNCSNAAAVTTEAREAGGILGLLNSGRQGNYKPSMTGTIKFVNCVNTGAITSLGGGAPSAGGILGRDHNQDAYQRVKVIFDGCKNSGNITVTANANDETHAAGIAAGFYSNGAWLVAKDCENTGNVVVIGSGDIYAGGLISYGGVVELINSTSSGTVTGGNGNKYVGGVNHILFLDGMNDYADTIVGNTYYLNGGVSPELSALMDDSGNYHLVETAYKEFGEFLGWYDNPEFTGNAYTSLNTGVKTYYAKWKNYAASVGGNAYDTLQAAINAANAGDTITLLSDITEDVTISKAITIDGAGKTYTGAMTLKADTTIKNVNFDGKGYNGYAVTTRGAQYVTIEDCTAKNYGYGFVQLASATALTTVKNVTVSNVNYGVKIDYSGAVVIENADITAAVAAVLNSNFGEKTITIKNSKLNILGTWDRFDKTGVNYITNYVFEGANTIDSFIIVPAIDSFKLAKGATLTAPNEITISTDVENGTVLYEDGKYYVLIGLVGKGTEEEPYLIKTLKDLIFFRDSVNAGETKYNAPGVYVALAADIDLAGIDWSVNIGDDCNATFKGIFDGKGFTIKNLTSTETAQKSDGYICAGLFGAIYGGAVIKNLTIENVTINTGDYTGNNVAAVVGFAYSATGSIENVTVKGNIQINANKVDGVGAIVGYAYGGKLTVKDCVVDGAAMTRSASAVNGQAYVGGIIGYAGGKVTLSNNTVQNIAVNASSAAAGGVAGIILGGGVASNNVVKNVTMTSAHENWKNAVGTVAGTFTGNITVSNTVAENNSTDATVGVLHANKPTSPLGKAQATIGDVYYGTFAEAYAAAKAGETITLLVDITSSAIITIDKAITLDGNGHKLTSTAGRAINVSGADGVTIKNLTINCSGERAINVIQNATNVTIENVIATAANYAVNVAGSAANAVVTINSSNLTGLAVVNVAAANAKVTITGSTINCNDKTDAENYGAITLGSDAVGATVEVDGSVINVLDDSHKAIVFATGATVTGVDDVKYIVAMIGYAGFFTLADAIKAAKDGDTVKLLRDVTLSDILTIDKAITLDGNGHKLTSTAGRAINVATEGQVTIKNLTIDAKGERAINVITKPATLTIDNVTATAANYTVNVAASAGAAKVTINKSTLNGLCTVNVSGAGAEVTIADSTINCNDNNTTAGEGYAALSLNRDAIGGKIVATNTTVNVAAGSDSVKGRNAAENGTVTINGSTNDVAVMVAVITYEGSNYYHSFATLADAIKFAKAGDTVTLIRDVDYGTTQLAIDKEITLDLGGHTLTTRFASGGMSIKGDATVKNGTIVHASNTAAIKVWNAAAFENLVIDVQGKGDANKTIGGIVLQSGSTTRVGSIKNVTIKGAALTNGIETYNCGNATENVIGSMENVTINAKGTGMLISAPCGTATNCTISGGNNGIEIWIKGNYSASLDLVNSKVEGGVYAHDEFNSNPDIVNNGTLSLTVDNATTGADDITVTIARAEEFGGIIKDVVENAQAKLNNTYYATFAEAYAAAQEGETIVLLAPIVVAKGETLTLNKNVTITYTSNVEGEDMITVNGTLNVEAGKLVYVNDSNGANVTVSTISACPGSVVNVSGGIIENRSTKADGSSSYPYAIDILTNGNMGDVTVTIKGGKVYSDYMAIRQFNNGTACKNILKVTGGEIYGAKRAIQIHMDNNAAYLTISGGKIEAGKDGYALCLFATTSTNIKVEGGQFIGTVYSAADGFITGGTYSEELYAGYLNESYGLSKNADGTYGVVKTTVTIGSVEDLLAFKAAVTGNTTYQGVKVAANSKAVVLLTADLDLANSGFAPIGNGAANAFSGTFDGQGHTISNMTLSCDYYRGVGFFRSLGKGAVVKNVTFVNANVNNGAATGGNHFYGVVAGFSENLTLDNVDVKDSTVTCKYSGAVMVGCLQGATAIKNADIENVTLTTTDIRAAVYGIIGNSASGHTITIENNTVTNTRLSINGESKPLAETVGYGSWSAGQDYAESTYVAQIGDKKYSTLNAAIKAAQDGDTIVLLANVDLDVAVVVNKTVVLNLNNCTVKTTERDASGDGVFHVVSGGDLTINGEGTINGVGGNDYNIAIWADGGKVTINGGYYTNVGANGSDATHFDLIYVKNGGVVVINGGKFEAQTPCWTLNRHDTTNGTITVQGGTFVGFNPANNTADGANTNYVADGYCVAVNGNEYHVAAHKYDNVVVTAPTFDAQGYTTYKCDHCGDSYDADYVPALVAVAKIGEQRYQTLAEAFAAAKAGDTITVFAGNYTTDLSVGNGITLVGETDASGNNLVNITGRVSAYTGATVKNLNIHNEKTGDYDCAISANGSNIVIDGVKLTGYNGMRNCYAKGNVTIKNSTINGSYFAVHFDGSNGGNLTIDNCDITGWVSYGGGIDVVTIKNSTLDSGDYAGQRSYADKLVIEGCTFEAGYKLDIAVTGSTVTVTDTVMSDGSNVVDLFNKDDLCGQNAVTVNGNEIKYVARIGNAYYTTLAEAIAAASGYDFVTIKLVADATLDYNAREAYGRDNTTDIIIDGQNFTLTLNQKNSDWSSIGMKNADGKLTLKNMTIEKTGHGDTSGAWNTHAINFTCNVEMKDVIVNNSISVQNGATLKNVTINEANGYYGLWIKGNGQTVTVNGGAINATNGGRGIKIADEYVGNDVASVALNVNGTAFNTAKKAAILVSSTAGATITATNVDITNVAADSTNVAWVDEDWATHFGKVTVNGAAAAQEAAETFVATLSTGTSVKGYYKTLAEAFAAAKAGDEVKILVAGTYTLDVAGKNITITGAVDGVVFDNIGAKNMGGANVTFNNVTFDYYPNTNYTGLQHSGDLVYNNCTFNGQVFLYGQSETFNNCTFNQNSADAYNVWTYGAKKVTFNECTFNSVGKSVLIYAEDGSIYNNVTVADTTFNASAAVAGKAAIEMDSSLTAGITLNIANSTANGFANGNVSGNSLWNNKKDNHNDDNNDITVVVDGAEVLKPVVFVAQIGSNKYDSLQAAIDAAVSGDKITVIADHKIGSIVVAEENFGYNALIIVDGKDITIDFAGHTVEVEYIAASNYAGGNAGLLESVIFIYNDASLTVTGTTGGIYIPENANVSVYSMFYNCGGKLTINDGAYTFVKSHVAGAVIYAEDTHVTTINGGIYTLGNASEDSNSTKPWIFNTEHKNQSFVTVTGGKFNQNPYMNFETQKDCEVRISADKYFAQGADGYWSLADAVAKRVDADGDIRGYATFAEALAAARNGETVVLLTDVTLDGGTTVTDPVWGYEVLIVIDNKVTIDFNGYTVFVTPTAENANVGIKNTIEAIFFMTNSAELTLKDSSAAGNGGIKVYEGTTGIYAMIYNCGGKLTIENGHYRIEEVVTAGNIVYAENHDGVNHDTTVNGGNFHICNAGMDSSTTKPWIFNTSGKNESFIKVNGGTFNQNILMNEGSAKDCEVRLPNTHHVHADVEGVWRIEEHTLVHVDKVDATCTTAGNVEHYSCKDCGKNFTDTTCATELVTVIVPALGHTWVAATVDAPKTCTVCGATEGDRLQAVAHINGKHFATLAEAIAAAQAGDTIYLMANITEDVTVNKDLTIDGNNLQFTGNISVKGSQTDVTVKNVNFVDGTGYAITTNTIKSITVQNCTVKNYGYGFLYANKTSPTVNVKNVTVDNCNYGFHWVYGSNATLENVTMTNVTYGLYIQNYASKTVTIKNSTISTIEIWERSGYSGVQTFVFEGNNTVEALEFNSYTKYVLGAADATLTAPDGATVTTEYGCKVVEYADGAYKVVAHSYNAVVTAPTCTDKGYTTHTCTACGDTYVDTYVDELGHNYTAETTAPTCTAMGYTTHTCACGDSYVDSYVNAIAHNYVIIDAIAPTCSAVGYTIGVQCSACGTVFVQPTEVAKLDHTYVSVVTAPTCTAQGYTTHTCTACGDSYVDTYVDALGHNWIASIVTAPTCTDKGYTTHICACGVTEVDNYVDALGHSYTTEVTAPTLNAQGYTTYTCTVCNHSYKDNYVDALTAAFAVNGINYATLADAIKFANAGDTIQLVANVSVETLFLNKGITLDLNGYELTANAVIAFNGNHIVDNSDGKTGRLVVAKEKISLAEDNKQMPIWTGETGKSYAFAKTTVNAAYGVKDDNSFSVQFRPTFGSIFNKPMFGDGASDNGVKILVRVSWIGNEGPRSQDFTMSEERIASMYTNNTAPILTVSGVKNLGVVEVEVMVVSDTGVVVTDTINWSNDFTSAAVEDTEVVA